MSETLFNDTLPINCQDKPDQQDSNIETECSAVNDLFDPAYHSPLKPKDHKSLFSQPADETRNAYSKIFEGILKVTLELEDSLVHINIRDDYSIKPSSVILKLPARKLTN